MLKDENRLGQKKQLKTLAFVLGLVTASAFFIPFIVSDSGYFIFYGDFNVQQIPFYRYCHEFVRSGSGLWSFDTDLGANFIGSYSFYLLGSPFFWLTLPFPTNFLPYLMGPLLILKFACASLTGYMFIRRFTARAESAVAGGLLYAFSGFSIYNIFFNHFHEAIVFFPLLLLAMELFWAEKHRGPLIAAVFICALSNYFFFFGMVVFTVIYWLVRTLSGSYKFRIGEFFLMLLECAAGFALAAALLVPSITEIIENSRVSSYISGWGAVMYGKEQIFLNVIECFFFPPDLPARPVFFPGADVKWASLGGWLPVFGMTGAIAWLMSEKKGTWLRRIIVIMIIMALVPGLNSSFYMLNSSYYARWFYMPILMMCLATALAFEDTKVNWKGAWRWSMGITLAFTAVIGFVPNGMKDGEITGLGLYTDAATNPFKYLYQLVRRIFNKNYKVDGGIYDLRFWMTCLIALLCLLIVRMLIPVIKEKKSAMFRPIIASVCVVSVIYAAFFVASGQSHSYDIDSVVIDSLIEGDVNLDFDEDEFGRIDVYDGVDNTGLYLGYPSINFFHSIVPAGVTDFYNYIGVTRTVGSRPSVDYSALRPLLSVKYLLDPMIDNNAKAFAEQSGITKMPGYEYVDTQDGYMVYENTNYIPMGFCYDCYMTEKDIENYEKNEKTFMMLKGLLVSDKNVPEVSRFLKNIKDVYNLDGAMFDKTSLRFSNSALTEDCAARAGTAAYSFTKNSSGFTAKIDMKTKNYVFFSVPYSEGFTAYVNGEKTDIIKVNKGFMAVLAPEGDCTVEFRYETPGLALGIIISSVAAAVAALYLIIVFSVRRIHGKPATEYPEGDVIKKHCDEFDEANYLAEHPENDSLLDDIDHANIDAYSGIKGGFKIDDSVLDDLGTAEEESCEKKDKFFFRVDDDDSDEDDS